MKAVLISIQPKWVEKIASGEKTIEVRKTKPKLETPFKCYIYETKGKQVEHLDGCDITYYGRGKVIGEFVCDRIAGNGETIRGNACLSEEELINYCNGKDLYFWHILEIKIYDKPKELSEFIKYMDCKNHYDCCACHNWDRLNLKCIAMNNELKRPPQSWCYVEELQE